MKRLLTLALILSTMAVSGQAGRKFDPNAQLEGHSFKWTDDQGINYAGEVSKGVGVAVVNLEQMKDFFVVRLVVTNFHQSPLYVDVASFAIIDKMGNTYQPTLDSDYTYQSNFFMKTLNPFETNEGFLYFKIPEFVDKNKAILCFRYSGPGIKVAHFPLEVKPW